MDSNKPTGLENGAGAAAPGGNSEKPAAENFASWLDDSWRQKKRRRRRAVVVLAAVVAAAAAVLALARPLIVRRQAAGAPAYTTYTVRRGEITVTLSGSGTLQPADSYTVTALVSGDILSAPFEEGDMVEKGAVLYTIDSSDVSEAVRQAENSLAESRSKYSNALKQLDGLNFKSGGAGTVVEMDVGAGDEVAAGQKVAVVRDGSAMLLKVLFQREFAESIVPGEPAEVYVEGLFEPYPGTVKEISSVDTVLQGNIIGREVTIEVENPGAFTPSLSAAASVRNVACLKNGTFAYRYEGTVTAGSSGTVAEVRTPVGSRVEKGQILVVLENDALKDQLSSAAIAVENAESALEAQRKKLDNYTIRSPISGTVVEKTYKQGDKVKGGEALCTVYDMSHLELTLNVDELDIGKVQPGQAVEISAPAAGDAKYTGTVTKVNIKGTTTNGVTSYPVTIRLESAGGLLPGMNVDAKIIVESLKDVLTVPAAAVQRGSFVLLKTDSAPQSSAQPGIPAGFEYTKVELGPSDGESVVVTGGLKEGDVVAVLDSTPSAYNSNPFNVQQAETRAVRAAGGPKPAAGPGGAG